MSSVEKTFTVRFRHDEDDGGAPSVETIRSALDKEFNCWFDVFEEEPSLIEHPTGAGGTDVLYEVYVNSRMKGTIKLVSNWSLERVVSTFRDEGYLSIGDVVTVEGWGSGSSTFRATARRTDKSKTILDLVEICK